MRVKVVTAFVPLDVKHLSAGAYRSYGDRMRDAIPADLVVYDPFPLKDCWLYQWLNQHNWGHLLPATPVPADRYATPYHMVQSNIVQHQRTSWLVKAAHEFPEAEVLVWLDLAILKQGDFTGKRVEPLHIYQFVEKIKRAQFSDIPFPGIWDVKAPPSDTGDNWRFCGSTHVIPREHLFLVDEFYRYECRRFIQRTSTVPLDLPIWALTELNSTLPFRYYQANHDATQLTEFPYGSRSDAAV